MPGPLDSTGPLDWGSLLQALRPLLAQLTTAPADPQQVDPAQQYYQRNQAWMKQGATGFNTPLAPEEEIQFRQWLTQNNVPFNASAPYTDYDMRGFWKAMQSGDPRAVNAVNPNDQKLHYPDFWKTPYHQTFSAESQWADPTKAPAWNAQDQLVTPQGAVVFDERAPKKANK